MNKTEILQFLNSHPVCFLATVEGDQPRVRGMMMYRADENGLLFHSGTPKDVCRQLARNPKVELCFNDMQTRVQIRVAGTALPDEDQKLKEEIVQAREFLKPIVAAHGYGVLKVFRVTGCYAAVWTFERNSAPKEWVPITVPA